MAKIIWSQPALDDLEEIAGDIACDKPDAAKRLVRRLVSRLEQLTLFPQSGGKPRDLDGTPYRQLVVPPLKIFYRVSADRIYLVYVMRGERKFSIGDVLRRDS